jgi:hypothetical protein
MPTPTNLPDSFSVGETLTSSDMNLLRGAFRILQVVDASTTTLVSSVSTTYADTTLSATITPRFASSKILVIVSQNGYSQGAATGLNLRLLRGSTTLQTLVDNCYGTNSGNLVHTTFCSIDSPNTTSAVTYKTQMSRSSGSSTVFTQPNSNPSTILLFEVSA